MDAKKLKKIIARPLSDADISAELPAMLKREFTGDLPAVILYEKTPFNGHWAMLHKTVNKSGKPVIEFFDSYGMLPDQAIELMNLQDQPDIVKYLYDSGEKIEYNQYPFQKIGSGINTCGRHCMVRHRYKNMSIDEYHRRMKKVAKKTDLDFDQIVSILTE